MKKPIRWILGFILLFVIGFLSIWGWTIGRHAYHLMQLRTEIKGLMQTQIESLDPGYALDLLHQVENDLQSLTRNISPLYPILPVFGPMSAEVEPALAYLDSLVQFGLLFEPQMSQLFSEGMQNQVDLAQFMDGLVDPELIADVDSFAGLVIEQRNQLQISNLPYRFQDDFLLLDKALPLISLSREILPNLSSLIGTEEPVNYLVLALNHDELRAGGGFITAIGTMTVQNLTNVDFDMQDSYQVDDLTKEYPIPPKPMQDFMLAGYWLARDANWSADFPESARSVQQLYHISRPEETRGVIAFDQEAVRRIVETTGPIQVDAQEGVWVDQYNILDYMHASWGSHSESQNWWQNRKDFISVLGKLILNSVIDSHDVEKVLSLTRVSFQLLKEGHLMLYFNDPALQTFLHNQELDHSVEYKGGDFLYWVDSNIGFNKMDSVIQKQLRYEIDLTNANHPLARLTMRFENPVTEDIPCEHIATYGDDIAYQNMRERCYWNYWRVYIPPESELIDFNVSNVPAEWLLSNQEWSGEIEQFSDLASLDMIAGLLVVPTSGSREITFTYQLPASVVIYRGNKGFYHLDLRKQLGLINLPCEIIVRIPDGYQFVDIPEQTQVQSNLGIWAQDLLESSEHLTFSYQP